MSGHLRDSAQAEDEGQGMTLSFYGLTGTEQEELPMLPEDGIASAMVCTGITTLLLVKSVTNE